MWLVYEACIGEYYDSVVSEDESRVLAEALRRMLSAARGSGMPVQEVR
jgi:hypothetical protein